MDVFFPGDVFLNQKSSFAPWKPMAFRGSDSTAFRLGFARVLHRHLTADRLGWIFPDTYGCKMERDSRRIWREIPETAIEK